MLWHHSSIAKHIVPKSVASEMVDVLVYEHEILFGNIYSVLNLIHIKPLDDLGVDYSTKTVILSLPGTSFLNQNNIFSLFPCGYFL